MVSLSNGTNLTNGHGAHGAHHGPFAGYFFCFALLCGILARQVGSTSWKVYADYNPTTSAYFGLVVSLLRKIPYTCLLLLLGMLLGAIENSATDRVLAGSTRVWGEMDPHLILNIFLPGLIFASAYHVNYHVFMRSFFQILILAVPGMLVSSFLYVLFLAI